MILAAAAVFSCTGALAASRDQDDHVRIAFAANGGLRDWQLDHADPSAVFVRDRTDRWYHVRLSGPCAQQRSFDTMVYTTDATEAFDTFSNVSFPLHGPMLSYGVEATSRSAPPPQIKRPAR